MMAANQFAPHGMPQQHPGVPQGHNMAPGMAHNPSQPGSQPGGIPAHLAQQMGVSAPGGQVNPSALMGGMPGGPNAHAMQHLNPQVHPQMYGQSNVNMNCEPPSCLAMLLAKAAANLSTVAAQQMQHQRLQAIQQQRQQQMMAQQMYQMQPGAMPMGQNNYMHPSQIAQLQAMQARSMQQRQQQPVGGAHQFSPLVVETNYTYIESTAAAGKTRTLHKTSLNRASCAHIYQ